MREQNPHYRHYNGRETDDTQADRATIVRDLLEGQIEDPVRIVAFNTAQGWSRDVTYDIAESFGSDVLSVAKSHPRYRTSSKQHGR